MTTEKGHNDLATLRLTDSDPAVPLHPYHQIVHHNEFIQNLLNDIEENNHEVQELQPNNADQELKASNSNGPKQNQIPSQKGDEDNFELESDEDLSPDKSSDEFSELNEGSQADEGQSPQKRRNEVSEEINALETVASNSNRNVDVDTELELGNASTTSTTNM